MSSNEYKLRCSLLGHSMDVRAIAVASNGDIVTASRDETAKLWQESPSNRIIYEEKITYKGHTGYVTSVCLIPSTEESPEGFTVTGSKDSTILVFIRTSSQPTHTLTGHTDTVSCLMWKNDLLASGSWDHTIRLWKDWNCVNVLKGHTGPIWSLGIFEVTEKAEDSVILSASADKTLKCWKKGKDTATYSGHTDCVRGLSIIDEERFLSCSNDASVKLWKFSGECLSTFYGHTSFIYSVFGIESCKGFVTGSEDRSIRIWDSHGNNTNTVYVPAQSVWCVSVLPNSDIVAGSSDGVCRIFTQSLDRQAQKEDLAEFEESLSKFKVAVEDVGGIKKSDLPDKTFLFQPGKRDGQTAMIREGEKILCYSWSSSKGQWDAIGEVVGGAGGSASTSGKVLYNGREYDYVFDVDLDVGEVLKLPYNKGEDPWMVAQAFIHRHELPQDYLDQVANFITTNANVTSVTGQSSQFYDPFTGGNRYVPTSGGSSSGAAAPGVVDPFTGSGRYVPSYDTSSQNCTSPALKSQYFPQLIPLKFESVNKAGIHSKFEESNNKMEDRLTAEQINKLVDAVTSSNVEVSELGLLEKALQWPPEHVWPALDILRLALRSEAAHVKWLQDGKGEGLINLLVSLLSPSIPLPTQLLSLRCLTNIACSDPGKKALMSSSNNIISSVASLAPYPNKNMEIAATTLLINLSTILKDTKNLEEQCQLLSGAATLAMHVNDSEAQFRVLVAIGTLLTCGKNLIAFAKSLDVKPIIEKLGLAFEPQKVSECARHVLLALK
ncbi:UNVERIFIED_CONTAM: hypothetical protein RMT77_007396 [Armadillidium vulgare]